MTTFATSRRSCSKSLRILSLPRNTIIGLVAIAVATLINAHLAGAQAGGRVALLLAGEDYTALGKSPLPVRQVSELADGLKRQGFDVVVSANPSNAVARAALRDFSAKVENADVALIFVVGHASTSNARTYYLPVNSEITRETDFLSRGLAVDSFVQLAGRAKVSLVAFIPSIPTLPASVQSVSPRPTYAEAMPKGSVLVFSTSDKVPVSRVDRVSQQALLDLVDLVREPRLPLSQLVNAASAGGVGRVIGDTADIDLAKSPGGQVVSTAPVNAESDRRLRQAEERAQQAEDRARQAEAKARLEAQRAAELASQPKAGVMPLSQLQQPPTQPTETDTAALQLVEAMLGRVERRNIQVKLAKLDFYKGPLDSVFGDLTRQAIRDYQRSIGADSTGYLTPQQLQTLMK